MMLDGADERLELARSVALAAGEVLMSWLDRLDGVGTKATAIDLVTAADREAEALVRRLVHQAAPDDGFLGEETGTTAADAEAEWCWVVDPLDGTTNFVHGVRRFAVSVGLLHRGERALGVVHDPPEARTWWARRGAGAWTARTGGDASPIRVSRAETLGDSLLATGFPYDRGQRAEALLAPVARCFRAARGLRRMGAAALDLVDVAQGRFDGFWELSLQPWDLAAGTLLVEEAGGRVTGYGGAPFDLAAGHVVATNGRLHDELVAMVDGP